MTFLKVQAASIIGSFVYFITTFLSVDFFHFPHLPGVFIGNIFGGTAQFILCRNWVFKSGDGKILMRILKFVLVWLGNLMLSEAGVYFFTHFLKLDYKISVIATSVFLGVSYNYVMQKKFVFA